MVGTYARDDPSLRAFLEAEIARAHVELQALRVENARLTAAVDELIKHAKEAKKAKKDTRHANDGRDSRLNA